MTDNHKASSWPRVTTDRLAAAAVGHEVTTEPRGSECQLLVARMHGWVVDDIVPLHINFHDLQKHQCAADVVRRREIKIRARQGRMRRGVVGPP